MKPSEAAQAACDKLSFTDADTLALAKRFAVRRYALLWDSCLWNDTLGVVTKSITAGVDPVIIDDLVDMSYASTNGAMFLDLVVAIRFTTDADPDGVEVPSADWQLFFQLDPGAWNNVDSRRATPSNFVNLPREMNPALYGFSGVPKIKLIPAPNANGTLYILGKQQSPTRQLGEAAAVSADADFSIRGCENAIMAFVEGDLLEYSRQHGKAQAKFAEAAALVSVMKDMERNQQQQVSRIIPDAMPVWTMDDVL
jgi:hypothetical protein